MKINDDIIPVEQVGTLETTQFRIQFDGKLAHLLSSTLYSNKIKALIRELGTNAVDSNIVAKSKKPFDVMLPTRFDCNFTIRDYGTGLTPDQISNIYTVYGASDKTTSNKTVGCMGLGSKTPACYYTKSATIDSYVDGYHWSYQFHLGSDGIPCLTKLIEEYTQEPNGVKITVPVLPADITSFTNEARDVFQWFTTKPNITPVLSYPTHSEMMGYKVIGKTSVLMGGVLYPVDNFLEITPELKVIYNCNLLIEVKIGEVEPSISRETLSYTDHTKKNILKYLEKIRADITSRDLYKDCKNLQDARKAWKNSGLPQNFMILFPFNGHQLNFEFYHDELKYKQYGKFLRTRRWNNDTWRDIPIYIKDCWNVKQRLYQNGIQTCYLIEKEDKQILKDLDLRDDQVILGSTLTYTKNKRQKVVGLASKKWNGRIWQPERINDTDNIIYITGAGPPNRYNFSSQFNYAKNLDKNIIVHFISNKVYEQIKNKTNFVPMQDHVNTLIKNKQQILETYDKYQAARRSPFNLIIDNIRQFPQIVQSELKDYTNLKLDVDSAAIYNVAQYYKLYTPMAHKPLKDFLKKYPLLEHISYSTPINLISHYMEKVV